MYYKVLHSDTGGIISDSTGRSNFTPGLHSWKTLRKSKLCKL